MVNYLTRHRQRVRFDNAFSEWQVIPAGVLQGSIQSPLLFLLYSIDLFIFLLSPLCSRMTAESGGGATVVLES